MDLTYFINGFTIVFSFKYILYMFAGVFFGLILGALPGLTGTLGIALMLPFTYSMDPLTALVFLLSIYSGGLFGGAITAIMINTPGSPANIATMLDGYPMAQKGFPDKALGLALISSVFGGLIGCIFLLLITEPLANLSLKFGPAEMFMVAVFGLSVIGSLSSDIVKSMYSGMFGLLLGTIGMNANGIDRGTFGIMFLLDGIPLIPVLIGFLSLPEIFSLINQQYVIKGFSQQKISMRNIIFAGKEIIKRPMLTIFSSVLGVFVGIMPAAGATVASLLSYNQAKNFSKTPELFGTGIPEGIISCETANNASEGGALSTMLVLGIPGSASTAMLLGALMLQGWVPGPSLFIDHREIIYASISSLFLQQFVMFILGVILCYFASYILKIPSKYIIPCVLMFTVLGAFANRNTIFDVGLMLLFGIIGYVMKKNEYPVMPVVLGIILGPIADRELLRVVQMYEGNYLEIFTKPIVLVLIIISILSISFPYIMQLKNKR